MSKKRSSSGWPIVAIDEFVPDSIKRDVRFEIGKLVAAGARGILIQIPIEDFNNTLMKVIARGGPASGPFEPRLCGQPVASWTNDHVGVMGQRQRDDRVRIYGADGREYDLQ